MGILHFTTFLISGILLNITPGNDTIFILTRSLAHGKKAGIVSVLGISTGSLVHTAMAAFGLSLIIAQSMLLFNLIKYAGAAYLVYIGFQMIMERKQLHTEAPDNHGEVNYMKVYRDATITNILNPKVALFFIAFLPQFIDPDYPNHVLSFILLGITFTVTGTIWCLILAVFAASIFSRLRNNKSVTGYITKVCGAAMIGLGIKVAIARQ